MQVHAQFFPPAVASAIHQTAHYRGSTNNALHIKWPKDNTELPGVVSDTVARAKASSVWSSCSSTGSFLNSFPRPPLRKPTLVWARMKFPSCGCVFYQFWVPDSNNRNNRLVGHPGRARPAALSNVSATGEDVSSPQQARHKIEHAVTHMTVSSHSGASPKSSCHSPSTVEKCCESCRALPSRSRPASECDGVLAGPPKYLVTTVWRSCGLM